MSFNGGADMAVTYFQGWLTAIVTAILCLGASAGDVSKGKKIYDELCWRCHGRSGKSDGPVSFAMDPRPRDLTDRMYMSQISDEELLAVIKEGGAAFGKSPAMMAFKGALSDDDIRAVIAFIRTLCCR